MLKTLDYGNRMKSTYECDRCNKELNNGERYSIYIGGKSSIPHKKWDLCNRCYASLERGIEKGRREHK